MYDEESKTAEMLDEEEIDEAEDVAESEDDKAASGTAYERETVINFNNAEKEASYYTLNYGKRQMLLRLAEEYPDDVKIVSQRDDMVEAILPKSWIKVRPPRKMTEEERQKLVERGKALAARAAEKRKKEAGK